MSREQRALSRLEQYSWRRLGRVLAPGTAELPPYDYINAVVWVPEILAASSQEDEESIRIVAVVLGVLPLFLIRLLLRMLSAWAYKTGAIGALPRLLMIGLKGVVYTSYYAGLDRDDSGQSQVFSGMQVHLQCLPMKQQELPPVQLLSNPKNSRKEA